MDEWNSNAGKKSPSLKEKMVDGTVKQINNTTQANARSLYAMSTGALTKTDKGFADNQDTSEKAVPV